MQEYGGLRCGIEIHQQLETHKLFCPCPSIIRDDEPDGRLIRRIRPVAGETGDVDPAALHELLKGREFVYEFYEDSNCLVELDEEPPHELNKDALSIALEISLLLHAKPVDEIHVMRKTVIDGSNTSGFQRTMLVATDGYIEDGGRRIRIDSICLEEDACRIIERRGNQTVYRVDRLGIPLVEIGTGPDIRNPEEAKRVAEKIGMLLRATGRVKRGLGTIRQDVNVSIAAGERIEIKGVQALRDIPKLIENEVLRQQRLIAIKEELNRRGFKGVGEVKELTEIFKGSNSKIIAGKRVFGIKLPKFAKLLGMELMPGYRFGSELADIAKELAGLGGIFHSDELPAYGITQDELSRCAKALGLAKNDALVMVAASEETARKALAAIGDRCKQAGRGVPKEVRRADGELTRFMRPLPGSARMYPETDEPVITIDRKMLNIKLSKTPEERMRELESMGLSKELANQLIHSQVLNSFMAAAKELDIKASVIASALLAAPAGVDPIPVLRLVASGRIAKESIEDIMKGMREGKKAEEVAGELGLFIMGREEVEKRVKKIIAENKGAGFAQLMGKAMSELRGRADAAIVQKIIRKSI